MLYDSGNVIQLCNEFPENREISTDDASLESFITPLRYFKKVRDIMEANKEKYYDSLAWFAKKLVECYEVCQTCPEYKRAKTDDIMIGIRGLVQRLMAELPTEASGTSDAQ